MFLHAGAGIHRHEYSAPLEPSSLRNAIPRRSPLIRSTFSSPIPRIGTTYEKPPTIIHSPSRPLSAEYLPRNNEHSVRFQESDSNTMSEGRRSVAMSDSSEATAGERSRRRLSVIQKTTFLIAKPPPTALTEKLKVRPKRLLQLQRLADNQRPTPAVDVLTTTTFAPRLIKKFPRMLTGKAELGVNDVMVVRSEDYDQDSQTSRGTESDDDGLASREVLAVICQMPKDMGGSQGKAEIALNNGEVWMATPLPKGHFEFTCVKEDESSEIVRWVKKNSGRKSDVPLVTGGSGNKEFKFNFSVMNSDPTVRKHPVIARLFRQGTNSAPSITIPDTYEASSSSSSTANNESEDEESSSSERAIYPIEDDLKLLIQITGIWVVLHQGLSPNFKYEEGASTTPSPRAALGGRMTPDATKPSPDPSTPGSIHSTLGLGSVKGRLRRSFSKASPTSPSESQLRTGLTPKRSVSAASAIMGRERAKRPTNLPSTITSDGEELDIISIPKRAVTENITSTVTLRSPLPISRTLPNSVRKLPETPTRPQRRTQSAYIPPNTLASDDSLERHSVDIAGVKHTGAGEKQKSSWRTTIKNFFKRQPHEARSD